MCLLFYGKLNRLFGQPNTNKQAENHFPMLQIIISIRERKKKIPKTTLTIYHKLGD